MLAQQKGILYMTYPAYSLVPSGKHYEEYEPVQMSLSSTPSTPQDRVIAGLVMGIALGTLGMSTLLISTKNQNSGLLIAGVVICTGSGILLTALAIHTIKSCKNEKQPAMV